MVAVTERYRRLVEKRQDERRHALLPMRVIGEDGTLFEGPTLEVSATGVYFRMPDWERLHVGSHVSVELDIPAELSGGPFGRHIMRQARVIRIDERTLSSVVGCRPRACGVALEFEPEAAVAAEPRAEVFAAAVA
jgi:hypothetical protein